MKVLGEKRRKHIMEIVGFDDRCKQKLKNIAVSGAERQKTQAHKDFK